MADSAKNVFNNAILPFDVRKYDLVLGSAQLVVIEVVVSKLIRKILGMGGPRICRTRSGPRCVITVFRRVLWFFRGKQPSQWVESNERISGWCERRAGRLHGPVRC